MSKPSLRVQIYGARGSYSPTNGVASAVGVNTTSFRLDVGDNVIIIDAGSGIINLGQELVGEFMKNRAEADSWKISLFFTHMHIDHMVGFPYFAMIYMPKSEIQFYAPRILDYELEDVLSTFVHPPLFPVSLDDLPFEGHYNTVREGMVYYIYQDRLVAVKSGTVVADGWLTKMSCMRNYMHPKGGSFFYRLETCNGKRLVIASDTEGLVGGDQRLVNFAKGADILFHDAQYTKEQYAMFQGFGHSTYEMACDVARQAGVDQLILIHHDPRHSDDQLMKIQENARRIFTNTSIAKESMVFELP